MVHHLEVAFRLSHHFSRGVVFEAKQDFQKSTGWRWAARYVEQMTAGVDNSSKFVHTIGKRDVFEGSARYDHVERLVSKWQ